MSERIASDELTPGDAAVLLGVTDGTVRAWLRDGVLPGRPTRPQAGETKRAGHWRVRREDVEALRQKSLKPDARVPKRQAQADHAPATS
ncbi:MAG: helix-turn-helix domain-containing protein [Candidatus Dormibacteraeota bacterium]|nr:helix-turn-helix domain-containing protein [Candidatus Dormibacteraeota bacterium]